MESVAHALYSTVGSRLLYISQRGRQVNCRCLLKHEAYCMSVICCCARVDMNLCIPVIIRLSRGYQISWRKERKENPRCDLLSAERHQVCQLASNLFRDTASFRSYSRQANIRIQHISHTYLAGLLREGTPLARVVVWLSVPATRHVGHGYNRLNGEDP